MFLIVPKQYSQIGSLLNIFLSCIYFLFFVVVLGGGTSWHLPRFLQYIKYIMFEITPSTIRLYYLLPNPGNVSTGIIFPSLNIFKQKEI
jgi:multisubunit Na+/H+ antiporter MnhE subunit